MVMICLTDMKSWHQKFQSIGDLALFSYFFWYVYYHSSLWDDLKHTFVEMSIYWKKIFTKNISFESLSPPNAFKILKMTAKYGNETVKV